MVTRKVQMAPMTPLSGDVPVDGVQIGSAAAAVGARSSSAQRTDISRSFIPRVRRRVAARFRMLPNKPTMIKVSGSASGNYSRLRWATAPSHE